MLGTADFYFDGIHSETVWNADRCNLMLQPAKPKTGPRRIGNQRLTTNRQANHFSCMYHLSLHMWNPKTTPGGNDCNKNSHTAHWPIILVHPSASNKKLRAPGP